MFEICSFIGKVIAYGCSAAGIAYLIFNLLGQKWIEEKFAERLEAFKHAQDKELEQYRNQVSILFSRITKIHEKEIEILPEIWQKLQKAIGFVSKITSPLQYAPDFQRMGSKQ